MPVLFVSAGDLLQCSQAADRLTKKQVNPDIESDYERGPDENQPTQITGETISFRHALFLSSMFPLF